VNDLAWIGVVWVAGVAGFLLGSAWTADRYDARECDRLAAEAARARALEAEERRRHQEIWQAICDQVAKEKAIADAVDAKAGWLPEKLRSIAHARSN